MVDNRQQAATAVINALERQAGQDVLPAEAALSRILNGVFKLSGFKFHYLAHGRMRYTFDIVSPHEDLGLVLKLGNKQATARDIALTLAYPDDRATIFAASDYGVVAERVDAIKKISDPRLLTPEFEARVKVFNARYIGVSYEDCGFIGNRIVMIGSSTRVIKQDALVKGSASQQWRAE